MRTEIQEAALAKLNKLKVGALFMEMGTGKTRVALDLMATKQNKCNLFLWICPCSLKGEIENERLKWHPELNLHIVGVESIGSSSRIYLELLGEVSKHSVFCVVDESLRIKNKEAKRTKRILELSRLCRYRLILNGTPLSRNILDLWSQMEFLSPKILNMDSRQFKYTYCEFKKQPGRRERFIKNHNIPHLISKIEPYIFDAKLFLEIPKTYYSENYFIDISDYKNYKDDVFREFAEYTEFGDLKDFSFYRIITLLQRYYTSTKEHHEGLKDLIDRIGEPVIVFVKFLRSIPDGALALTGDVPADERSAIIERHRAGEQQALYVTYGLGAYGLNLQHSHNVIFAEHTWDYAQRIQAEARIYRMGQTEECRFYDFNCNTGLERLLHECNDKKENLAEKVKREISRQKLKEAL